MSRYDSDFENEDTDLDYPGLRGKRIQKKKKSATPSAPSDRAEVEQQLNRFTMTYQPARYEEIWLRDSLRDFFVQGFLVDVLSMVKGGKEASVYRCAAHPRLEIDQIAVKVYRPRMFRNLRNDAMYRQGRAILTGDGRPVKETDHRIMRAVGKKTDFGVEIAHASWLLHEYTTIGRLYDAGAQVPKVYAVSDNAILMQYFGDEKQPAHTMHETALRDDEAKRFFTSVLDNIEIMIRLGIVHGDLSAYNILYWQGKITLIDFPQVTNCFSNPDAYAILERDIIRVCEYFAGYGIQADPQQIARQLWQEYVVYPSDDVAE
jgi:RIO kinase 1